MEVNRPTRVTYIYRCRYGEVIPDGITHLQVHKQVRKISDHIFEDYQSLVEVALPSNVLKICNSAFARCQSITVVEFSNGLRIIDDDAFAGCSSLRQISLPPTVEYLGRNSFLACTNLTVVHLNEGITEIAVGAFSGCKSLTEVSIPKSVTEICYATFQDCVNLLDVKLEHVHMIAQRAFMNCRSLCAISLPNMKRCVGWQAFRGCKRLLSVELSLEDPKTRHDRLQFCFDGCISLVNVSLPKEAYWQPESGPYRGCNALAQYKVSRRTRGRTLTEILQKRFRRLPIHKLCYNASTTRKRDLVRQLQAANAEEKNKKDVYGMSPFHIFATTATLRKRLLQALLASYPLEKLKQKDSRGYTMVDYLFHNLTSNSVRIIQFVLHKIIVEQMDQFLLESWKEEVSSLINSLRWNGDYEYRRLCMNEVLEKLGFCMRNEMAFHLELAIWKHNIRDTETAGSSTNGSRNVRRRVDREACRVTSGAAIAIPFVLDYLWDTESPDFSDFAMAPKSLKWLGRRPNDPTDQDNQSAISISSGSINEQEESSSDESEG